MPTEIDSLQISINAKAKSAEQSIDTLVAKLDKLSTSLGRINGSSLSGLASGVSKLGNATQTLKGVKATEYNRIASGFERFARIDSSGLSKTASGLNTLARSMASLSSIPNLGNTTSAINAIKNLARVDMSGFDTAKMNTIATTMGNFADKLSSVGKIDGSVTRVVSAMARLSNSGQYIGNVVTYFPQLGNQVVSLVGKLSSANAIDLSITKIVDGIARLASAGKKIEVTVANLGKLGDGVVNLLRKLQSAPRMSAELANIIQGLGNIASSGSRAGSVLNGLGGRASKTVGPFKRLSSAIMGTGKSTKGFVSSIGMFYAKFFLVIRAIKGLGKAIGSAQDYIEDFNYFSVALTKVGEDSRDNWKEAGYDSAQEYVDSFKNRFQDLQKQMTGYTVDAETGELDYNIGHNLGLDISEVMRFQSSIAQITNSAGMLGETSIMTSKALSMLSADLSSLSNQDLSAVQDNLQSGLIGQSRALYKYGIDITQAGLQQTAYANGLDVTVKNLSQASKMQLRLLTILGQSKVAYGDLGRTINQPANQLRMLQAGFQNLARTVGQIFMPIVQKLYPYLNAVVMVLQEFAEWIAKLTGANLKGNDTAMNLPDYEPAEDGSEAVADNTEKASKSAKKLSDNLQGFDIINKLDSNNSDVKKDDEDGTPKDIDLSKQIASALGNYQNIWDDAFKNTKNKAVKIANTIKKVFGDIVKVSKPTIEAIKKLWSDGLSKLSLFNASNLINFFDNFLKPMSKWYLGDDSGLPRFFNITNDLLNEIDWNKLETSLARFYTALQKPTKFAWNTLMDFYESFLKPLTTWTFSSAIPGLTDAFTNLINGIDWEGARSTFNSIFSFLSKVLTDIGNVVVKIVEKILPKVSPIINDTMSIIKQLVDDGLKPLWNFLNKYIIPVVVDKMIPYFELLIDTVGAIVRQMKTHFSGIIKFFKGVFSGDLKMAWDGIKQIFSSKWKLVKDIFGNVKTFFANVVGNVKKPFENIANWFKDTFSKAWQNVKDVFSSDGKIFSGIKTALSNVFTSVVNVLIKGLNTVIAKPFKDINSILNKVKDINILGAKPFGSLWKKDPLVVPQIPEIKKYEVGGFLEDGLFTMNRGEIAGKFDNGKSVVANNKQITDGIAKAVGPAVYSAVKQAMAEMPTQGSGDVYLDGKKITDNVVGHINQVSRSRGNSPLWGVTG